MAPCAESSSYLEHLDDCLSSDAGSPASEEEGAPASEEEGAQSPSDTEEEITYAAFAEPTQEDLGSTAFTIDTVSGKNFIVYRLNDLIDSDLTPVTSFKFRVYRLDPTQVFYSDEVQLLTLSGDETMNTFTVLHTHSLINWKNVTQNQDQYQYHEFTVEGLSASVEKYIAVWFAFDQTPTNILHGYTDNISHFQVWVPKEGDNAYDYSNSSNSNLSAQPLELEARTSGTNGSGTGPIYGLYVQVVLPS